MMDPSTKGTSSSVLNNERNRIELCSTILRDLLGLYKNMEERHQPMIPEEEEDKGSVEKEVETYRRAIRNIKIVVEELKSVEMAMIKSSENRLTTGGKVTLEQELENIQSRTNYKSILGKAKDFEEKMEQIIRQNELHLNYDDGCGCGVPGTSTESDRTNSVPIKELSELCELMSIQQIAHPDGAKSIAVNLNDDVAVNKETNPIFLLNSNNQLNRDNAGNSNDLPVSTVEQPSRREEEEKETDGASDSHNSAIVAKPNNQIRSLSKRKLLLSLERRRVHVRDTVHRSGNDEAGLESELPGSLDKSVIDGMRNSTLSSNASSSSELVRSSVLLKMEETERAPATKRTHMNTSNPFRKFKNLKLPRKPSAGVDNKKKLAELRTNKSNKKSSSKPPSKRVPLPKEKEGKVNSVRQCYIPIDGRFKLIDCLECERDGPYGLLPLPYTQFLPSVPISQPTYYRGVSPFQGDNGIYPKSIDQLFLRSNS